MIDTDSSEAPAEKLLLSVVIPAHNVELWLGDLLESVLAQDIESMEVIVVDDHSTDRTVDVIRDVAREDGRVRAVAASRMGSGNARNQGAALARGEYLLFVDADDVVAPGALAVMIDSLERSGSDVAVGGFDKFSENLRWSPSDTWGTFAQGRQGVRLHEVPFLIRSRTVWNKIFRSEFWRDENITFPEATRSNDIVPAVKAYLGARAIDVLPIKVYGYRVRPGDTSMTSRAAAAQATIDYLQQELICARDFVARGRENAYRAYCKVVLEADIGDHVSRYLAGDHRSSEADATVGELTALLLDHMQTYSLKRAEAHRLAPLLLAANGHIEEAHLLSITPAEASHGGLDYLDAWISVCHILANADFHAFYLLREVVEKYLAPTLSALLAESGGAATVRPLLERLRDDARITAFGDALASAKGSEALVHALRVLDDNRGDTWVRLSKEDTGVSSLRLRGAYVEVSLDNVAMHDLSDATIVFERADGRAERTPLTALDAASNGARVISVRVPRRLFDDQLDVAAAVEVPGGDGNPLALALGSAERFSRNARWDFLDGVDVIARDGRTAFRRTGIWIRARHMLGRVRRRIF